LARRQVDKGPAERSHLPTLMKVKPGAMVVAACSRRYHTVIGLRVGFAAEAADDERGRCRNTIALSINSRRRLAAFRTSRAYRDISSSNNGTVLIYLSTNLNLLAR